MPDKTVCGESTDVICEESSVWHGVDFTFIVGTHPGTNSGPLGGCPDSTCSNFRHDPFQEFLRIKAGSSVSDNIELWTSGSSARDTKEVNNVRVGGKICDLWITPKHNVPCKAAECDMKQSSSHVCKARSKDA